MQECISNSVFFAGICSKFEIQNKFKGGFILALIYLILIFIFFLNIGKIFAWLKKLRLFLRYTIKDIKRDKLLEKQGKKIFREYGLTMFVGPQGSGKTISMVDYCLGLKEKYPNCKLYSNFTIEGQDGKLKSMNDLLKLRNGEDGIIFCIDEIQNEFSTMASRNFPETLLSTLTMQRKQRIHIVASSQVFTRVAKPIREQCFHVVECRTFFSRWTRERCYYADEYNSIIDSHSLDKRRKLRKVWKKSFIQTDELRETYDTMEVVRRLSRQGFADRIL